MATATSAAARPIVSWNAAAITRDRRAPLALGDHARDERRGIEHERRRRRVDTVARTTHASAAVDRARERLQLDRGLRLVADARAAARATPRPRRTAGPCWSSPARGRARRGRQTACTVAASTSANCVRRIGARELRPDRRHAPRLADRGDSSRHRDATEMPDRARTRRSRRPGARRPRACRRRRSRARRTRARAPVPVRPCSTMHAATCAWWCCTATTRKVEVERELGRQVLRVEIVRDHLGAHAVRAREGGRRPARTTGTSRGARGRRCDGWRRRRRRA